MHRMIVFDDGLGQFGPMTDLRASFEIRTGMYTTARRIAVHRPKTLSGYWVPPHLRTMVQERADAPVNILPADEEVIIVVNGRWSMPDPSQHLDVGDALVEEATGHVIAARLRRADAEYFLNTNQLHERVMVLKSPKRVLYKYPWDIIAFTKQTIPHDILSMRIVDAKLPDDVAAIIGQHPVEVHQTAKIYPNVTLDAEHGPIIIHERATVRPGAVLCGPCSIGADSTVLDRAVIKANTVIGPHCKVAGEVGATIFQGFSNKAHDGYLGDSWVGKWVNFGAGTTNSNLLNTYGEVVMRLETEGPRFRTGLQFLGAIIGDHAKFAICTRLMTGSVIGTGAMVATTQPPPTTVPRFAWLTDEGARSFRLEKFIEVATTVMGRRHVEASEAYLTAIRELYSMTAGDKPAVASGTDGMREG